MTHIGKNIKKIRNVKGLSQQSFADLFSLTRGNISSYEESRAEPKIEVIVKIANFFGIPLSDLIEKDLSVNELLHYNTNLVIETERLKTSQQLIKIPFVSTSYKDDYIKQYNNNNFIQELPYLVIPSHSKSNLIAFELDEPENLPSGFDFRSGDILIFEEVTKENIHRIINKLGIQIDNEGIKSGIYKTEETKIYLCLNDWIKYLFDIESDARYWILRASCKQEL
ncbi:MAG: helix-turn-helix domain-containing protein [Tannerella sp.]|nr:helix-turn-helix domain-containing protein [Tannerella sp.]